MKAETAIEMLHELICAEVALVNENNSRKNGPSKRTIGLERIAVEKVFMALVERNPTQEEITKITEL